MADFLTWAQAVPNLAAFWPLDDASAAATGRDLGPNAVPITKNAGATFGGASIVAGITGSARIDASAGAVATALQRAIASGSALDVATQAAGTLFFVYKAVTLTASGTPDIVGRSGSVYSVRQLNSGVLRVIAAQGTVPGGQAATGQTPFNILAGDTVLVALTWGKSGDVRLLINGVVVATHSRPGTIPASAVAFVAGSSAIGPVFDIAGIGIVGREMGPGELRDGYLLGGFASPTSYYVPADAGTTATSGIDGGHADTVNDAMVGLARADQHGASRGDVGHVWPSLTDHATTVPSEAAKLIAEQIISQTHRAHASDPIYHDGTQFKWSGSSVTFPRATSGVLAGLAALHRFCGLSKRKSWPLEFAKKHGDWIVSQQAVSGQFFASDGSPSTYFVLNHLGMATYVLKDQLDAPRLAAWTASLEAAANYELTTDGGWYVNGNIELQLTLGLYLLYKVTGKASWLAAFEAQWAKTLYPTDAYQTPSGFGNAATAGYGLRSNSGASGTVNGAVLAANDAALLALSDTASQGYLAESAGPGVVARDIDYLMVQVTFAARLYLVSGDARVRKLLNVLVNTAITKLQLLAAPASNASTTAATGGSLAAATYFTKVVALVGGGESPVSAEQSIATTGAASTITQTWAAVTGATGYRVYIGTATGAEDRYFETAAVTTLTITTLVGATLKAPPTVNTALNWVLDATSGSRHNLLTSWLAPGLEVLVWKNLRPDLAIYDLGSHFANKILSDFRNAQTSSSWANENYWIGIGDYLTPLLTGSAAWPGYPA